MITVKESVRAIAAFRPRTVSRKEQPASTPSRMAPTAPSVARSVLGWTTLSLAGMLALASQVPVGAQKGGSAQVLVDLVDNRGGFDVGRLSRAKVGGVTVENGGGHWRIAQLVNLGPGEQTVTLTFVGLDQGAFRPPEGC